MVVNEKISFSSGKGAKTIKFKEKRIAAGLTQKEVAELLGVNQSAVHLWEAGETKPRASLLPKLSEIYGCTIDELLKENAPE